MARLYCGDASCKFWDRNKCRSPKVTMNWTSVMTVWEGRRDFLICKTREESEEYAKLAADIVAIFSDKTEGTDN